VFAHITSDPVMTEGLSSAAKTFTLRTARDVFGAKTKKEKSDARRVARLSTRDPVRDRPVRSCSAHGSDSCTSEEDDRRYYKTYTGVRRYMEENAKQVRESGIVRNDFWPPQANRTSTIAATRFRSRAEREASTRRFKEPADLVKMQ